ncbi:YkgJ family cysteine cluster protein [Solimicrobium silvestre]|nr:YkgJ family cysteine cluster protein [Solimicrobium silvestre]
MLAISQKIKFYRKRIPSFECIPGCHDCCGPVTTSSFEMSFLPVKTDEEHDAALNNLSCPHLASEGCSVYEDRPLICRMFGTTPKLLCPHGKRPEEMIDPLIEAEIHEFFLSTRQVLV